MVKKRQIAISGYPGAGKSTTGKLLAKYLGYNFFSAGDFRRMAATELGVDIDTLNKLEEFRTKIEKKSHNAYTSTPAALEKLGMDVNYHQAFYKLLKYGDTDIIVDKKQKELADNIENIVIEGRLAYMHFPDAFKIFFYCKPEIAAARVFNDKRNTEKGYNSVSDVIFRISSSMESDRKRYVAKYGNVGDCYTYDEEKFDIYIDTTNVSQSMVIEKILDAYAHSRG